MALDLQSVKVGNRRYVVNTADLEQKAQGGVGANKRTAEMVGGGAVLGTLIGAIAGGGKGAAIGAAAEPEQVPGHKSLRVASLLKFQRKRH